MYLKKMFSKLRRTLRVLLSRTSVMLGVMKRTKTFLPGWSRVADSTLHDSLEDRSIAPEVKKKKMEPSGVI